MDDAFGFVFRGDGLEGFDEKRRGLLGCELVGGNGSGLFRLAIGDGEEADHIELFGVVNPAHHVFTVGSFDPEAVEGEVCVRSDEGIAELLGLAFE